LANELLFGSSFLEFFLIYCFYNKGLVANFVHCKAGNFSGLSREFSGLSREFHRHEQGIRLRAHLAYYFAHWLIILVKNIQGGRDQATLLGVGP